MTPPDTSAAPRACKHVGDECFGGSILRGDHVVALVDTFEQAQAIVAAEATLTAVVKERDEARAANERDRSAMASVVGAVRKALMAHEWLRLGRGSYEYDDDRWKDEFSAAYDAVVAAIEPLRKIAADWTNCPTTPNEVAEARADTASRQLAEARAALQSLYDSYARTIVAGRERIVSLGGDCDTVERMEQRDPALREARALLSGETPI